MRMNKLVNWLIIHILRMPVHKLGNWLMAARHVVARAALWRRRDVCLSLLTDCKRVRGYSRMI